MAILLVIPVHNCKVISNLSLIFVLLDILYTVWAA